MKHINKNLFATTDMEFSSASITTMASIPVISPKVIGSWKPKVTGSRKFVVQDDPNTSDYSDPLSGVPKGKALTGNTLQLNGNLIVSALFKGLNVSAMIVGLYFTPISCEYADSAIMFFIPTYPMDKALLTAYNGNTDNKLSLLILESKTPIEINGSSVYI